MKMKIAAVVIATAALTACASAPGVRPVFPEHEYAGLEARKGTAVVTGQVFLRTRIGEVRYGAGSEVALNPVTSYSTFWYENSYLVNRALSPADPRLPKYIITTQADGSGNFRFENVPAGAYYLTSQVVWEIPGPYVSSQQGGVISTRIEVPEGGEVRQMLTR
ncbi:hypothetical protein [Luteimonas sp. FCS-9]|uniref:hypothetical protein n=1 Tax=Luteimonas sp. FCS-9 TaxID=1547516 RepID=UPI00063EC89C|nr:hypothetical protein [Luteimonas sp. FCS-9]KLJ02849.1 hypothetical protein WQ56_00785 [Luteimonas sp. FCS-9]